MGGLSSQNRRGVSISVGVAVGLLIPSITLGAFATHVVCDRGPVIGITGGISAPLVVGIAPPGGLVTYLYQFWINSTGGSYHEWGGPTAPENSTTSAGGLFRWNLSSVQQSRALGWGPQQACAPLSLTGTGGGGGCSGCTLSPPVPQGIGNRVLLPTTISYQGFPGVTLNATYPSSPVASFTWHVGTEGLEWAFNFGASELNATFHPFYKGTSLVGLAVLQDASTLGFGVPIELTNGTIQTVPETFPAGWAVSGFAAEVTYILPASDDQGTWEVFLAGGGSAYPLGYYLFVQTA